MHCQKLCWEASPPKHRFLFRGRALLLKWGVSFHTWRRDHWNGVHQSWQSHSMKAEQLLRINVEWDLGIDVGLANRKLGFAERILIVKQQDSKCQEENECSVFPSSFSCDLVFWMLFSKTLLSWILSLFMPYTVWHWDMVVKSQRFVNVGKFGIINCTLLFLKSGFKTSCI